ncbi:ferritin-like domain-containing protein [Paludibacterium purpuratum]|uniref:Uncharacterized protein (TIGR02284 family) n=1 Tax=Paludibacterium purpuratum TaxID=1144873 RepID=A0A4R7BE76_9NEIS|nr:PA2169 family four-helix-bundle protein [Paludibacterium purpuratum]TDR81967.1 uncharacterized protein (TIGR02284 family) [Paludibacterium purpuratum]
MQNQALVEVLNDLIEVCKDGEYSFTQSANQALADELKAVLHRRAADYRVAAHALQDLVRIHGGRAYTGGTLSGALYRAWVGGRSILLGQSEDRVILQERERGEAKAKEKYAQALMLPLPDSVQLIVQRQYEGLLENYVDIATLCDRYRSRAES